MSNFVIPLPISPASSVYEDIPDVYETTSISPLVHTNGVLKVHTSELNSYTYIQTKHICGLHFIGNRISIQTSVPCQGQLSYIMFICPRENKQNIVELILKIIDINRH
jgi:hypothetical protein